MTDAERILFAVRLLHERMQGIANVALQATHVGGWMVVWADTITDEHGRPRAGGGIAIATAHRPDRAHEAIPSDVTRWVAEKAAEIRAEIGEHA